MAPREKLCGNPHKSKAGRFNRLCVMEFNLNVELIKDIKLIIYLSTSCSPKLRPGEI